MLELPRPVTEGYYPSEQGSIRFLFVQYFETVKYQTKTRLSFGLPVTLIVSCHAEEHSNPFH